MFNFDEVHTISVSLIVCFPFPKKIFAYSKVNVKSTNKPIKSSLHFCYKRFLSLAFVFGSFLVFIHLCLHCPAVHAHCLLYPSQPSEPPGKPTLLIVVLRSWSDNSHICAISDCDVCFVTSDCVFCLL